MTRIKYRILVKTKRNGTKEFYPQSKVSFWRRWEYSWEEKGELWRSLTVKSVYGTFEEANDIIERLKIRQKETEQMDIVKKEYIKL